MSAGTKEPRRNYYPCLHCGQPVYRNDRAGTWLHAQTGKRQCEWLADPDTSVEPEHGYPII